MRASVAAVGAVVLAGTAYTLGSHEPHVSVHRAMCLSAPGTISCETEDGDSFRVPRDVAWQDRQGRRHIGGRPDCLPPSGIGEEGPVTLAVVEADLDDVPVGQVVVWVSCD
jgi:hypothetical protein